jgi:hypothetical protein
MSSYDGQVQVDIYETKEQWDGDDPFIYIMPWSRMAAYLALLDVTFPEGVFGVNIFPYVEEEVPAGLVKVSPVTPLLSKAK